MFEILDAWKRLIYAKKVTSLVETMKSAFFPRSVRPNDLHGSLLVNAKVSFAIDF